MFWVIYSNGTWTEIKAGNNDEAFDIASVDRPHLKVLDIQRSSRKYFKARREMLARRTNKKV
jgi:hypothetical protein|tara:strand:+ start:1992 stop:2177 length:186 start_codon:yes stop_codon:yes gene_type:complete